MSERTPDEVESSLLERGRTDGISEEVLSAEERAVARVLAIRGQLQEHRGPPGTTYWLGYTTTPLGLKRLSELRAARGEP